MDTRYRPLEISGVRTGDQPALWQRAVIEERSRLAREIHDTLVQDFAGIVSPPRRNCR
ncbi:MAG: histidine kinase [Limisphaerales bacterium]